MRDDHIDFEPDEFGCDLGEAIAAPPRPSDIRS
jgi:hypothetical protein